MCGTKWASSAGRDTGAAVASGDWYRVAQARNWLFGPVHLPRASAKRVDVGVLSCSAPVRSISSAVHVHGALGWRQRRASSWGGSMPAFQRDSTGRGTDRCMSASRTACWVCMARSQAELKSRWSCRRERAHGRVGPARCSPLVAVRAPRSRTASRSEQTRRRGTRSGGWLVCVRPVVGCSQRCLRMRTRTRRSARSTRGWLSV
jgi:hypothetical protein